jgi:hypothetical protein
MIDQQRVVKIRQKNAPSGRVKALDELLDLPHLDVLFRYVLTHIRKDVCELLEILETQRPWKGDEGKGSAASLWRSDSVGSGGK